MHEKDVIVALFDVLNLVKKETNKKTLVLEAFENKIDQSIKDIYLPKFNKIHFLVVNTLENVDIQNAINGISPRCSVSFCYNKAIVDDIYCDKHIVAKRGKIK